MGTARTVAKNSAMIFVSSMSIKVLALVFAVYVVRYMGAADYGKYSFVFSLMTVFTIFSTMGLDSLVVLDTARDPAAGLALLPNAAVLKTVFVLASWLALAVLVPLTGKGGDVALGAALVGFCLLPDSAISAFKAYFSGRERMELNTFLEVLYRVSFVGMGLCAVALKMQLAVFFMVPAAASLLTLAVAAAVYRRTFGGKFSGVDTGAWAGLVERGYPFMLAGVFVYAYRGLDTVIISLARGDAEVGLFSSARALTDSFLFLPAAVSGALLPAFSRILGSSVDTLKSAYGLSLKLLLYAGLLLSALVSVFAADLVVFVYGRGFAETAPVLRVLTWSTSLAFLNIIMTTMLSALGKQKAIAGVVLAMAVVSVASNLAFIPAYGITAAAWTAVAAEGLGLLLFEAQVQRHLRPGDWALPAGKALAGGAALFLAARALRPAGFFPSLLGGLAAYGAVLFLTRALDGREAAVLMDAVGIGRKRARS